MRLVEIAKLVSRDGMIASIDLLKRGELTDPHIWTAIKGAKKYLAAVAIGDVADESTRERRAAICEKCDSVCQRLNVIDAKRACYCGPPFDERETTCGCLVGMSVESSPMRPGGKTIVGSESCPQGKW